MVYGVGFVGKRFVRFLDYRRREVVFLVAVDIFVDLFGSVFDEVFFLFLVFWFWKRIRKS